MTSKRWMMVPVLLVAMTACGGGDEGASTEAWCDLAQDFENDLDGLDSMDVTDPDSVRAAFEEAQAAIDDAADAAPDEIKDAVETTQDGFAELAGALEDVDYNFLDLDMSVIEDLDAEMEAASDEIDTFNEEECGIEPTEDEATDDTTDLGEGTPREQMAQVFVEMGLDEDAATCLSENMDPEMMSEVETNPAAMMSIFEECGVTMEQLAELGG